MPFSRLRRYWKKKRDKKREKKERKRQQSVESSETEPVYFDAGPTSSGAVNLTSDAVHDDDWRIGLLAQCPTKTIRQVHNCPTLRGCPACGTLAAHDGGDKHMSCPACACEFCFVCLSVKDVAGNWQCGGPSTVCRVAPRQTSLPSYVQSDANLPLEAVSSEREAVMPHAPALCLTNIEELSLEENDYVDDGKLQPLSGYIELSAEPCCVTFDDTPEERAKMPCGHVISVEAMKHLCDTTLSKNDYEFKCPAESCSTTWEYFMVRRVLSSLVSPEELEDISRNLNNNYVSKKNIEQCPMCGCYCERDFERYTFENRNRVTCLVCTNKNGRSTEFCWSCVRGWKGDNSGCGNANCDTVWKIHDLTNCGTKKIGPVDCPEIRGCPRCGTLINHNGGCKHMNCSACKCAFCFVCLKPQLDGKWQCGTFNSVCKVAPRQTSLPESNTMSSKAPPSSSSSSSSSS